MRFETAPPRKPSPRPLAGAPPRVERPATAPAEPGAVGALVPAILPGVREWLARNHGAIQADIRLCDPARVPEDIREALRLFRPLVLAQLVADAFDRDGDSWTSYRLEVDGLEAGGLPRPEALRQAYRRRFAVDPGDIDPEALSWLWE